MSSHFLQFMYLCLLSLCGRKTPSIQGSRLRRCLYTANSGMITNDTFCMIRQGRVKLRWSRRPYRFRPRKSDYAPEDRRHEEHSHETPLADTTPIPADGGRSTTVGPGLPISSGLDCAPQAPRRFRPCTLPPTTDG